VGGSGNQQNRTREEAPVLPPQSAGASSLLGVVTRHGPADGALCPAVSTARNPECLQLRSSAQQGERFQEVMR
jgi:hypothetical protein